jgi:hypothetical protein
MGQLGFFDLNRRYEGLNEKNERLVAIAAMVPCGSSADAQYRGPKMAKVVASAECWKIEIVKRSDPRRFIVLPEQRVAEPSFALLEPWTRDFKR